MDNCELTLNDNFNFKNDIFNIKKKKRKHSENFYYKLSLTKEEKNNIKEKIEKNIMENHKEIKQINEKDSFKEFNLNNNDDIKIKKDK